MKIINKHAWITEWLSTDLLTIVSGPSEGLCTAYDTKLRRYDVSRGVPADFFDSFGSTSNTVCPCSCTLCILEKEKKKRRNYLIWNLGIYVKVRIENKCAECSKCLWYIIDYAREHEIDVFEIMPLVTCSIKRSVVNVKKMPWSENKIHRKMFTLKR